MLWGFLFLCLIVNVCVTHPGACLLYSLLYPWHVVVGQEINDRMDKWVLLSVCPSMYHPHFIMHSPLGDIKEVMLDSSQ